MGADQEGNVARQHDDRQARFHAGEDDLYDADFGGSSFIVRPTGLHSRGSRRSAEPLPDVAGASIMPRGRSKRPPAIREKDDFLAVASTLNSDIVEQL